VEHGERYKGEQWSTEMVRDGLTPFCFLKIVPYLGEGYILCYVKRVYDCVNDSSTVKHDSAFSRSTPGKHSQSFSEVCRKCCNHHIT
jgi:hypothetical protein